MDKSKSLHIVGVDEVGRGAWAGSVVVGAVLLPSVFDHNALQGVTDSKLLSDKQRRRLVPFIEAVAQSIGIGTASQEEIDEVGLRGALTLAFERAVALISPSPDFIVSDANLIKTSSIPFASYMQGEVKFLQIASASIVAKVYRDTCMLEYSSVYPQYGFDKHKGYGTKEHRDALALHGVCPLHRRSFAPIQRYSKGILEK